ncbi:hypothetical protein FN976_06315 [Caenimonas sedimenti]|uniref:DUF5666 domain-containing protein n=1 Tax=Caenimonas sedimenti TaxID=2596921 RepID=A0A562ZVV3_9BURK|nr:hypothetical protein [Caenimonas sedimenti]TWO72314.1 hypothetical protein FN976_06315 [Caenimonas sedimenti]
MRFSKYSWAAAVVAALATASCGGGGDETPVVVAAADVKVATTQDTVKALSATNLSFPAGVPALGTTGPTALRIVAPAGAVTPTFNLDANGGTASGTMSFGSCVFTVSTSTIPSLPAGTVVRVDPCTINVDTSGDPAGQAIAQPVTLTLGTATSTEVTLTVTVSSTGAVTINNVNNEPVSAGAVTTTTATGGS